MNYEKYEKIINNIKKYAPIESGVQTLIYMFLDDLFDNFDYDLTVIDNMQKKSQYNTYTGISDIAVLKNCATTEELDSGNIIFCIEVKALSEQLEKHKEQLFGQLLTYKRAIITNGKRWLCYDVYDYIRKNSEFDIDECWYNTELEQLSDDVHDIIEKDIEVAYSKSCLAHTRRFCEEKRARLEKDIEILEKELSTERVKIDEKIKNSFLREIMEKPRIKRIIGEEDEDGSIIVNREEYICLITELYDFLASL